ncbi:zinc-dependent alcohol dehydrogenase [Amycolatopsis sp. NBC_01480]|uniref:zinc-dependent alcohol dehydrogenase n=1 Tax=Amycolatopsis sp. NBC_01480 TaxID=2903562 RepID=UPI002E2B3C9C|nr:alcohol dehydrogenase catalytic domain-containing protein [Amycolatopsis sp. NBC_01480]
MKAFVVHGPGEAGVAEVAEPEPGVGEVVVEVERAGVCGTDVEFFTGEMEYLAEGHARYPMRLGHEWCGTVVRAGEGVHPAWVGRRAVGDTMLGCGRCRRCRGGRQHTCADRQEVGIRGGRAGALAERLAVPVTSLHELPDGIDGPLGALVEPGGNAVRAARAAAGERVLVLGPGTIGLLTALFARAAGAEVHLVGTTPSSLEFARSLGFPATADLPEPPFDAVVDATNDPSSPARGLELVEPGGRLVCIGLAGTPSRMDARSLVFKDVTAIGILSASPGLADAVDAYARGDVDPRPLVAATVGLDGVAAVLAGERPAGALAGPKILVDPQRL